MKKLTRTEAPCVVIEAANSSRKRSEEALVCFLSLHFNQFFFFFFQFCIPLHPQTLGFPSDSKLTTLLLLEAVLCLLFWLKESRREDFMWNDVLDEAWIRRIQCGEKNNVFWLKGKLKVSERPVKHLHWSEEDESPLTKHTSSQMYTAPPAH